MKRIGIFVAAVILVAVGWWWYDSSKPLVMPYRLVMSGTRSFSGDFGISDANLTIIPGKPGVCYGTVILPGQKEKIAYVILFRSEEPHWEGNPNDPERHRMGIDFRGGSDGKRAEYKGKVILFGRVVAVLHGLDRDTKNANEFRETLQLGPQPMDLTAGRVFLLDLNGETPVYRQINVPLPEHMTSTDTMQNVEDTAVLLAKHLERQSQEVRAFLR